MNVTIDCACGAQLSVDDSSELATEGLVTLWHTFHGDHRRTLEEYQAYLDRVHRRWDPEDLS